MKIASWNIEGRLSHLAINSRGTPAKILAAIEKIDADVLFLAEAFSGEEVGVESATRLHTLGYHLRIVAYEEGGEPRHLAAVREPSMILLSRLPIIEWKVVRLGDLRNALVVTVEDPKSGLHLRVIGVHLDDRTEAHRLRQAPDLIRLIKLTNKPTVVMGDFNAMHGRDIVPATLLRSFPARIATKYILSDLALRAVDMARGDTLRNISQSTGYRDADRWHRPTSTPKLRGREWLPSIRLMQIDHILLSPRVKSRGYKVWRDLGSDHRAISTYITLDKQR